MEKYVQNHYEALLVKIRLLMREKNVTQKDLGTAMKLTQSSVSALLNGDSIISLPQLLSLAIFFNVKPQHLLSDAELSLTQAEPMPAKIESLLYRSEAHLIAYCAATQPVTAKEIAIGGVTVAQASAALNDLTEIGVLIKSRDKYVQTDLTKSYVAPNRHKASEAHRRVANHSWKLWSEHCEEKAYRQRRFNYYLLERFTTTQIKEIETHLWNVYEKATHFQRENMSRKYESGDDLSLWNIHLMLMTPIEEQ